MPRKDERLQLAPLGEFYEDLLAVDGWIAGNSIPQQGKSLLSAKLQEKESKIRGRVEYLAKKRGISSEQMWDDILTGKAEKLGADEYKEMLEKGLEDKDTSNSSR
jgi:hypothetical protein